jgi:hypothetical protein
MYISSILAEADKRDIIVSKVGLPLEIADALYHLSKKHHLWFANAFVNEFSKEEFEELKASGGAWDTPDQALVTDYPKYTEGYELINKFDAWKPKAEKLVKLLSTKAGEGFNLKEYKTVDLALKGLASEEDEEDFDVVEGNAEIIIKYDNGYYWIDLKTEECDREAERMGHCGRAFGSTMISLRDKKTQPHVTIDYDESEKTIKQIKGKQNTKPAAKYWAIIADFILDNFPYKVKTIETTTASGDLTLKDLKEISYSRYDDISELFRDEVDIAIKNWRNGEGDGDEVDFILNNGNGDQIHQILDAFETYAEIIMSVSTDGAMQVIFNKMGNRDFIDLIDWAEENRKYYDKDQILWLKSIGYEHMDNDELLSYLLLEPNEKLKQEIAARVPPEAFEKDVLEDMPLDEYIEKVFLNSSETVIKKLMEKFPKPLLWKYIHSPMEHVRQIAKTQLRELGEKPGDQMNLPFYEWAAHKRGLMRRKNFR